MKAYWITHKTPEKGCVCVSECERDKDIMQGVNMSVYVIKRRPSAAIIHPPDEAPGESNVE